MAIAEAYEVLSDDHRRAAYDQQQGGQTSSNPARPPRGPSPFHLNATAPGGEVFFSFSPPPRQDSKVPQQLPARV
jgi:DnaJ-class molecular chaperone